MVDLTPEKISEDVTIPAKTFEEKEDKLLTELSESQQLKMELIEGIRHANDRKTKTQLIEEVADNLEKSTRTIRRMVAKVEQEGLSALASTIRSDPIFLTQNAIAKARNFTAYMFYSGVNPLL